MARRIARLAIVIAIVQAAVLAAALPAQSATARRYRVTITNLTHGQPLTPPVLAVHRRPAGIFRVGSPASVGVQEIAENGNPAPLVDALEANPHVVSVVTGNVPIVPANRTDETGFPDSVSFEIDGGPGAKYLSWESMLICTNDGFTGVSRLRLPAQGHEITVQTVGYDAGTELNTERFADIVPPCQGLIGVTGDPGTGTTDPALAEGGVVHMHDGIEGSGDLIPAVHGWTESVATLTITAL
ncbi:MAG: spondin domain-containing protein [Actinomycetota bacterium]